MARSLMLALLVMSSVACSSNRMSEEYSVAVRQALEPLDAWLQGDLASAQVNTNAARDTANSLDALRKTAGDDAVHKAFTKFMGVHADQQLAQLAKSPEAMNWTPEAKRAALSRDAVAALKTARDELERELVRSSPGRK